MTIEEAIRRYLMTMGGLTALVGERVHHNRRPQAGEYPAVVYFTVSRNTLMTLEATEAGLTNGRFQFESYGRSSSSAKGVDEQLRLALSGYRGTMGGEVFVHGVFCEDVADDYEIDPSGSDKGATVVTRDFTIHWTEIIPTP